MEEQSPTFSSERSSLQQLAAKCSYAADLLCDTVRIAQDLHKLQKKVDRYIKQVRLIITWKRGCGTLQMLGSAAKTAGGVMTLSAMLHPSLGHTARVATKLWKLGTGLKMLTCIGNMLRELWQTGCRNSLTGYVHSTALLTRNLTVFSEVIRDLQGFTRSIDNSNQNQIQTEVVNILQRYVPNHQITYIRHVLNIAFGNSSYSPLFDFMAMSVDNPPEGSNLLQLMQETESFNFTEFTQQSDFKSLVIIGSFLHISREMLDFLDGFKKVTDQDCKFLTECLKKFNEQSLSIMQLVSIFMNLDQIWR